MIKLLNKIDCGNIKSGSNRRQATFKQLKYNVIKHTETESNQNPGIKNNEQWGNEPPKI